MCLHPRPTPPRCRRLAIDQQLPCTVAAARRPRAPIPTSNWFASAGSCASDVASTTGASVAFRLSKCTASSAEQGACCWFTASFVRHNPRSFAK